MNNAEQRKRPESPSDAETLDSMTAEHLVLGKEWEASGAENAVSEAYPPTRYELLRLARMWYRTTLDIRVYRFLRGQTCGSDARLEPYARDRLDRIEATLGQDAVKEATRSVDEDYKTRLGDEVWQVFQGGTREQWQRVQQEVERQLHEARSRAQAKCQEQSPQAHPWRPQRGG